MESSLRAPEQSGPQTRASRTRSVACRLLSGSGSASLVVYHWSPAVTIGSLVHGVSRSGGLVVGSCPAVGNPGSTIPEAEPVDVRLGISKDAADPAVRIESATICALGTFEWLPAPVATRMLATDELPPHVAAIVASENGRLGMVNARHFLVHDSSGITPVSLDELSPWLSGEGARIPFPAFDEELDAHHVVAAYGHDALCRMCDAVGRGQVPGGVARLPLRHRCSHGACKVFCADVDRTGMVLLHVGAEGSDTVFAPFRREVNSIGSLSEQVGALVRDAALLDLPRI